MQLSGPVQGQPHIGHTHRPGYLPREGKEIQRGERGEKGKKETGEAAENGKGGRGEELGERVRESLRSCKLLMELLVLSQKHTALPDLSKARHMKCNLSLKFNSTRMKRKCFAEL